MRHDDVQPNESKHVVLFGAAVRFFAPSQMIFAPDIIAQSPLNLHPPCLLRRRSSATSFPIADDPAT
jgi:hypothetical protein